MDSISSGHSKQSFISATVSNALHNTWRHNAQYIYINEYVHVNHVVVGRHFLPTS